MPQLGSDEKPVLMTNKKNGGRIGKGSRTRPLSVSKETFEDNWDRIFNSGGVTTNANKKENDNQN